MDDLEFRRRAYAEPDNEDREFLEKKQASVENTHFVDELKQLDQKIHDAIHINPPEGLAERIKLNQQLGEHTHKKQQYSSMFSLVAGVLLAVGLVFTFFASFKDDLSQQVLTHVYDELNHLQDNHLTTIDRANQVLAKLGGKFSREIGTLRYVGACDIGNKQGVHMVMDGKKGPVTLLIMPETRISHAIQLSDRRFSGRVEPSTKGSYAIIAEQGEPIDDIKRAVDKSIIWQS